MGDDRGDRPQTDEDETHRPRAEVRSWPTNSANKHGDAQQPSQFHFESWEERCHIAYGLQFFPSSFYPRVRGASHGHIPDNALLHKSTILSRGRYQRGKEKLPVMANDRVPINYQTPSFPSLYDPLAGRHNTAYYLYHTNDIWRFTLYWTFIFYGSTHLLVAGYAVLTHFRHWSIIWLVPIIYAIIAALEALLAGSIVGLV